MIASTQITSTEIFAFVVVLVLSYRAVKFCLQIDNRNYLKVGYFLRKYQISRVNYCKVMNSWKAKL